MFNASKARSVYKFVDSCQPTTRRENTSSTNEAYTHPECVLTYVMSATHKRSWDGATNSRLTRSGRVSGPTCRVVVRGVFTREIPRRPAAFISRATVHRAIGRPPTPPSRASAAHTFRTPYTPKLSSCSFTIAAVVSSSRIDRRDRRRVFTA